MGNLPEDSSDGGGGLTSLHTIIVQHVLPGAERRSAKERLTQHTPLECHFSQVDQQTSLLGMYFYGMGGRLYCTHAEYGQLYNRPALFPGFKAWERG